MSFYMYCPKCFKVTPAKLVRSLFGNEEIQCGDCGLKIKAGEFKSCKVCGDRLYARGDALEDLEMPCGHSQNQAAPAPTLPDRMEDEETPFTDWNKLKIKCEFCSTEGLSMEDGAYQTCPHCGRTQSQEYITSQLFALTHHDPGIIEWNDPEGSKLLHVDRRGTDVPPLSLLVVKMQQHVVYDAGGDRAVKLPNTYAMFKDTRSRAEMIQALNRGEKIPCMSLNVGTRIIFFDERDHSQKIHIPIYWGRGKWKFDLALDIRIALESRNSENLLRNAMDMTDDDKATRWILDQVEEILSDEISGRLEDCDEADDVSEDMNADDVRREILRMIHNEDILDEVLEEADDELSSDFGIRLTKIRLRRQECRAELAVSES